MKKMVNISNSNLKIHYVNKKSHQFNIHFAIGDLIVKRIYFKVMRY